MVEVLPAGGVCARPGFETKIADPATMAAVIANAKPRPVRLAFNDMLASWQADTAPASPMNWSNKHSANGRRLSANVNTSYGSIMTFVNRVGGRGDLRDIL